MTKDIDKFCKKYGACEDGKQWALANCKNMADVWQKAKPDWLVWVATREGVLTDKELRLFAVWCCRQIWHLMTDERSRNAVEVAERFANGKATREELFDAAYESSAASYTYAASASIAASNAYAAYAFSDASAAFASVAASASAASASAAASAAASASSADASAAASASSADAAFAAVAAVEKEKQAKYLRDTYNPFGSKRK